MCISALDTWKLNLGIHIATKKPKKTNHNKKIFAISVKSVEERRNVSVLTLAKDDQILTEEMLIFFLNCKTSCNCHYL